MALNQDMASEGDLDTYRLERSESDLNKVGLVQFRDPGYELLVSHQHQGDGAPVAPNLGAKVDQSPKVLCPICGAEFHARKALTRHHGDCHSPPRVCEYPNCGFTCIGERKLKAHLQSVHGHPPPQ